MRIDDVPGPADSGVNADSGDVLRLTTAEIRWFVAGEPPARALEWYAAACPTAVLSPERVDRYLVLPEIEALGVKLREGRIELKRRLDSLGRFSPADSVSGQVERWEKWSMPCAVPPRGLYTGGPGERASWLAVRKARRLCSFAVRPDGRVIPMSDGDRLSSACGVELTQVECSGTTWWSVALESFGPVESVAGVLERVARVVFDESWPDGLAEDRSYGYPRWMLEIRAERNGAPG